MPGDAFADAWGRGDSVVRQAIDAFRAPSARCFLVYAAEYSEDAVRSVGALFAKEIMTADRPLPDSLPSSLRVGVLADALRKPCPTCAAEGYVYCVEYSDQKFDPDWHSDLHVLCLACPRSSELVRDYAGFYSPASSS